MLEGAAAVYFRENVKSVIEKTGTSSVLAFQTIAVGASGLLIAILVWMT